MSITPAQRAAAEQMQWAAARDSAREVRVVAGPGTGKSKVIEMRVAHVLNNEADPSRVYVISFTRAAYAELRDRITSFCSNEPCAAAATRIHISTMHSLALRILRAANLLSALYPSDPWVIDEWECKEIYDREFSVVMHCTPTRAAQIRRAHDAAWQTLNPASINQASITNAERQGFLSFHHSRSNLYSMVLPGEVIFRCVDAFRMNQIQPQYIPPVDHLIVDEFQDLNLCDQEFVEFLSRAGTHLFVAGDDDQSIYSFRHADPSGIIHFDTRYPAASTHILSGCFRCTPNILTPATTMISYNPSRIAKDLVSLYQAASPPVAGRLSVWSFPTAQEEAAAIASSCRQLINAGLSGHENEILILITDRGLQLALIEQELGNLGLPYEPPRGESIRDDPAIRCVYSMLRVLFDRARDAPDYIAHRSLISLMSGVGSPTAVTLGDLCLQNNQNFRDLFYLANQPVWLTGRAATVAERLRTTTNVIGSWDLGDTIDMRAQDILQLMLDQIFTNTVAAAAASSSWNAIVAGLPGDMILEELLSFLQADTDSDQSNVLQSVQIRLGINTNGTAAPIPQKIRILTMHGAKGLSGKVVFIPSVEQGILPSFRAIQATGLLIEQRRLFYVSVTRGMAACIVSHAAQHHGAPAQRLVQQFSVSLTRSQFLNELGIPSASRSGGLTANEAASILSDLGNL
ncbi:MAG: ATP-dependent helicase [Candidatus Binataceae bacterium]